MNIDFLQTNVDITNLSNFRTLAHTRYYFEIHTRQDIDKIEEIIKFAKNNNLKILFIGGGTNLLFAFDMYEGIIIKNCLEGRNYDKDTKILEVFSGEKIWNLAKNLETQYGQDLWHRFIGLPGTVGGAVFGNAGCFGLEIESNFVETEVLDLESGIIETLNKEQVSFSYRSSIFKETKKYFIIKTKFDLNEKIEKYSSDVDNIDFRENKQPKGNSGGSFFKNPSPELSAGSAIEAVGLKGYHYNRAFFSDKHANFLINDKEGGSWQDLLFLIDLAKTKVKAKFKVELEPEVRIIR
ncbi:MAG: UDP-N-acetylmuramate dehydrogenase [Candidatus Gracilibacteria bacterium]|nr:UDP-N-acetylmuramate dehydrogenase [Candidatus Gracilibacteria bacterium]